MKTEKKLQILTRLTACGIPLEIIEQTIEHFAEISTESWEQIEQSLPDLETSTLLVGNLQKDALELMDEIETQQKNVLQKYFFEMHKEMVQTKIHVRFQEEE